MPIPADRLCVVNWQGAGMRALGGIPVRPTVFAEFLPASYGHGATSLSTDLNQAILECPINQRIDLGEGDFSVDQLHRISKAITVRGRGKGRTRVKKTNGAIHNVNPPAHPYPIFEIAPGPFPSFDNNTAKTLTADAVKGAYSVTVSNTTGLYVGQRVAVEEDSFFTNGAWIAKPQSAPTNVWADAVPNEYQVWRAGKLTWMRHRSVNGIAIASSDAATNEFTTVSNHGLVAEVPGVTFGSLVSIEGHSGIVTSPTFRDKMPAYVVSTTAPNKVTLRAALYELGGWDGPLLDVTTGGAGGAFYRNRPGDDFLPGDTLAADSHSPLRWFNTGNGYYYGQILEIESIAGNLVTFSTPFCSTYRVSQAARLVWSTVPHVVGAGIEDMTLLRGGDGGIYFRHAAESWARNVEIAHWYGHGIGMAGSHRIDVFECDIHDGAWPTPGGAGYAIAVNHQSSECRIENNATWNCNKNIVMQGGGAACVVVLNSFNDAHISYNQEYVEVGLNASHMAGPHHVLMAHNDAHNHDEDFTHGTTVEGTVHGNVLRGFRRSFPGLAAARCNGLAYGSRWFSIVGNVLGEPGAMSGWTNEPSTSWLNGPFVWMMGYDPYSYGQLPDPEVAPGGASTTIREQNFNHLTNTLENPATTPDSYAYDAAPDWWPAGLAWPPVNAAAGTFVEIPARTRFLRSAAFAPMLAASSGAGGGGAGGGGGAVDLGATPVAATGTSAAPSVTFTPTAGRLVVVKLTTKDLPTVTPPGGLTLATDGALPVFASFQTLTYWKIATGAETAFTFALGAATYWALAVAEFTGMGPDATLVAATSRERAETPASSGSVGVSAGQLVIATLADTSGTLTVPDGFAGIVPTGAGSALHHGTEFQAMQAVGWMVAAGGGALDPAWVLTPNRYSGAGVYVFQPSAPGITGTGAATFAGFTGAAAGTVTSPGGGGGGGWTPGAAVANTGNSSAPAVTFTTVAGRLLVVTLNVKNVPTITPPGGLTLAPDGVVGVFGQFQSATYWKIATGAETMFTFGLSTAQFWVLDVVQFDGGIGPTLRDAAARERAETPASPGAADVAIGDLILTKLFDADGALTVPSGFTGIVPTGAGSALHHGTEFTAMLAQAYRVATAGGTTDPGWALTPNRWSGAGVYTFQPGAPSGGATGTGAATFEGFTGAGDGTTGYAALARVAFEQFAAWPDRDETVVAEVSAVVTDPGGVTLTGWTIAGPGPAYGRAFGNRTPALPGATPTLYQRVTGALEMGADLAEAGSLSAAQATPGSWWWDEAAAVLYLHTFGGVDPDTLESVAARVTFYLSTGPLVIDRVHGDGATAFACAPVLVAGPGPTHIEELTDQLRGAKTTDGGDLVAENASGVWYPLVGDNSGYWFDGQRVTIRVGGSYRGIALAWSAYQAVATLVIDDVAPTETTCTFRLKPTPQLLDATIPATPIFEDAFPRLGDGVRGTYLAVLYGEAWTVPALVDTKPGVGVSVWAVADASRQDLYAVRRVDAIERSGGAATRLMLGTDYTVDLAACTITVLSERYHHTTHLIHAQAIGKTDGAGGYLRTFSQITKDILCTHAKIAPGEIDTAAFDEAHHDAPEPLAVYLRSPRSIAAILASTDGAPSLEGSVHGTISRARDGQWSARVWDPIVDNDTLARVTRANTSAFIPDPRIDRSATAVTVLYRQDARADDSWSSATVTNTAIERLVGARPPHMVPTFLRNPGDAETLAGRYAALERFSRISADFGSTGAGLALAAAGDRVSVTYAPAPDPSGAFTDRVFLVTRLERGYAPRFTLTGQVRDVHALVNRVGRWMPADAPTFAASTDEQKITAGYYQGDTPPPGYTGSRYW